MDLLAYFRVLKRRWVLILVATVAGAALGAATTLLDSDSTTKTYYKATHSLLWDETSAGQGQAVIGLTQMPIFATTGDVPINVAKSLGSSQAGRALAEHITTYANTVTNTLELTAVAGTPKDAVDLADTFAQELTAYIDLRYKNQFAKQRDSLQTDADTLQKTANSLQAQVAALPPNSIEAQAINRQITATLNRYYDTFNQLQNLNLNGPPTSGLTTLESAQSIPIGAGEYESRLSLGQLGNNNITNSGSGNGAAVVTAGAGGSSGFKSPVSRGVLGALLGFLVGIGLAFFAERVDRKIRTHVEAEAAFGLPVLAEVPRFTHGRHRDADLVAVTSPLSRAAEAYRAIRTSVLFQRTSVSTDELFEPGQSGPLVLMVTSASPREGKTTTSANLAAVFAEAGSSVLVVNCDFRRPTIHRLFHVNDEARRVQETGIDGVKIVTDVVSDSGANPAQVVAAQRQVIAAARERFDIIILDTAPLLTANDAVELVSAADLVLLVARSGLTGVDSAQRSMDLLTRLEAPVGGLVLVGSVQGASDSYYYYQSGRGDAPAPRRSGTEPVPVRANGSNGGAAPLPKRKAPTASPEDAAPS
jgi:Mrp family chromosome partitioning ATPase/capsular polysaccharide biosynthesis protein